MPWQFNSFLNNEEKIDIGSLSSLSIDIGSLNEIASLFMKTTNLKLF